MEVKLRGVDGTCIFGTRTPQSIDQLMSVLEFFVKKPSISKVTWINCSDPLNHDPSSTDVHAEDILSLDIASGISQKLSRPIEFKHHVVPIPDEGAPSDAVYEALLPLLSGITNQNEAWVFSSRKGADRATTGMVIATLYFFVERKRLKLNPPPGPSLQDPSFIHTTKFRPRVLARLMKGDLFASPEQRILEVDVAIDVCGQVINFATELERTHNKLISRIPSPVMRGLTESSTLSLDQLIDEETNRDSNSKPSSTPPLSPRPNGAPPLSNRPSATPPKLPKAAAAIRSTTSADFENFAASARSTLVDNDNNNDDADGVDPASEIWYKRGHNLLEKYLSFILFNAFLHESILGEVISPLSAFAPAPVVETSSLGCFGGSGGRSSAKVKPVSTTPPPPSSQPTPTAKTELLQSSTAFSDWMKKRPVVFRIMHDLNLYKQLFNGISTEEVLKGKVLKYDHFWGISKLPELYKNAINFRKVEGLPVYGVGQCFADAFEPVLDHIARDGYSRVVWVSLRQEPVGFVYGRPFAPRLKDKINENVEYPGIDGPEIRVLEDRMKEEIVTNILTDGEFKFWKQIETGDNVMVIMEKAFDAQKDVLTLHQVYDGLQQKGKNVEYRRIPITDETAPEEKDFVQLVEVLREHTPDTAYVYNCQMGRGRTTTGMVTGVLLLRMMALAAGQSVATKVPNIQGPEFRTVKALYKVLPEAEESKKEVDIAIDMSDAMQNLREAIRECRVQSKTEPTQERRDFYLRRTLKYVERYVFLIIFHVYLREQFPKRFSETFTVWMSKRPVLYEVLDQLDPSDESEPLPSGPPPKLTLWQNIKRSFRKRERSTSATTSSS